MYQNPVYTGTFADPFVMRYRGVYYGFATGPADLRGRQFPVLRSTNLIDWVPMGGALEPVDGAVEYWAPEVAYQGRLFYMYYSARGIGGRDHQLRVASSHSPFGPYRDIGTVLVPDQPFTIDAHPFRAPDGQWYLYYSRDFLTLDGDERAGTGIVVDKLIDMTRLAGEPRTVVRPHADWQLFKAQRPMYGSIYDWHTIEGAATRIHHGRIYCFYSGGAWERANYGVSYVVADHPLGSYERPAHDGPLLKSVPGQVIGPGHNSFVAAPDGREMIVYHGWDTAMTARQLRIDPLTWDGAIPVLHGPTYTPQPAPWLDSERVEQSG